MPIESSISPSTSLTSLHQHQHPLRRRISCVNPPIVSYTSQQSQDGWQRFAPLNRSNCIIPLEHEATPQRTRRFQSLFHAGTYLGIVRAWRFPEWSVIALRCFGQRVLRERVALAEEITALLLWEVLGGMVESVLEDIGLPSYFPCGFFEVDGASY